MELSYKRLFTRYREKDRIIEPNKPFFISEENNINSSLISGHLLFSNRQNWTFINQFITP